VAQGVLLALSSLAEASYSYTTTLSKPKPRTLKHVQVSTESASPSVTQAVAQAQALVAGASGDRLGMAGIMVALLGADGRVRAANRVLRVRARGDERAMIEGRDFTRWYHEVATGNSAHGTSPK
jgi:hypothetical protein